MKPRFLKLGYFIWLIVPTIFYGLFLSYGLPHGRWSYSWVDEGQGYDPYAERYYTHCRYIGSYGPFDYYPSDGQCAWVRFYRKVETVNAK